jgi:two-component system sensor histidine kinase KdpD
MDGASFLQMIRRSERGRLKVYLGYAAGVGKTSRMLEEGHRLRQGGLDVVAALVEDHGRRFTAALAEGLEALPPRLTQYHGVSTRELDLDALLLRRPQVALVDELAHSNPPGSRNAKRYQDVQELRAAGIHVISTLNVQHLESLHGALQRLGMPRVRDRVPDLVLNDADEVVNVDLAPADLRQRLEAGQILPLEQVEAALREGYRSAQLEQLRELALRELAMRLDHRRREGPESGGGSGDQLMVALGPQAGTHAALLRQASRLAGRLNRNWYAVHVQAPGPGLGALPDASRDLANQLGAVVFTLKGQDVAQALLEFAERYGVGFLVAGKPRRRRWIGWPLRQRVTRQLLAGGRCSVLLVDADEGAPGPAPRPQALRLTDLLSPRGVLILDDPQDPADLMLALSHRALAGSRLDPALAARRVLMREARGSTFMNHGLALPHATLEGLDAPRMALGLTKAGLRGLGQLQPVEAVFLLLTPPNAETAHLELLSAVSRAFQDAAVRAGLRASVTAEQALDALALGPEGPAAGASDDEGAG